MNKQQQPQGQWAEQQKKWQKKQETKPDQHQMQNPPSQQQGDNRTPDEPIGQVAYAQGDEAGGDLENETLEPEKQGGIGGP